MPKYSVMIREVSHYCVEFEALNLEHAEAKAEEICEEAGFHPIMDFHSTAERDIIPDTLVEVVEEDPVNG